MKAFKSVAPWILILISSGALAKDMDPIEKGPTFGIQYNNIIYKESGIDSVTIPTVTVAGGYQWNKYLSTELRYGVSVSDGEEVISGTKIDFSIPKLYSGIMKLHYPVTKRFRPYLIGGYSKGEVQAKVSDSTLSASAKESDFSYGAGFSYYALDKGVYADLGMEYMVYADTSGARISGVNFVLNIRL